MLQSAVQSGGLIKQKVEKNYHHALDMMEHKLNIVRISCTGHTTQFYLCSKVGVNLINRLPCEVKPIKCPISQELLPLNFICNESFSWHTVIV
jgi:hypothetical protein